MATWSMAHAQWHNIMRMCARSHKYAVVQTMCRGSGAGKGKGGGGAGASTGTLHPAASAAEQERVAQELREIDELLVGVQACAHSLVLLGLVSGGGASIAAGAGCWSLGVCRSQLQPQFADHTHTHTLSQTHTYTYTHSRTDARAHTSTHTHAHTHTLTHKNAHTRIYACTHARTQSPPTPALLSATTAGAAWRTPSISILGASPEAGAAIVGLEQRRAALLEREGSVQQWALELQVGGVFGGWGWGGVLGEFWGGGGAHGVQRAAVGAGAAGECVGLGAGF